MIISTGTPKIYNSLVFRLLLSFTVILFIVFTVGNIITVKFATRSLFVQGKQQIRIQRENLEKQIEESRRRLVANLIPQIDLLAEVSRAPLLNRISELNSHETDLERVIVNKFRYCIDSSDIHAEFDCLELNSRYFMPNAIRMINRTFIKTTIHTILSDEDMIGVVIQDWENHLYIGYRLDTNGKIQEVKETERHHNEQRTNKKKNTKNNTSYLKSFNKKFLSTHVLQRDVNDDDEYLGQVLFFYHTDRIDQMREGAEQQIAQFSSMIHENIVKQRHEITRNRIIEGVVLFLIIILAISAVAIKSIVTPINRLKNSSDQLAKGNLDQEIGTYKKDELGSLASSFAHMRDAIKKQIDDLNELNHTIEKQNKELQEAEQERIRAMLLEKEKNDAEAAARARSEFFANISHEIRTPMTSIVGFTEIMKEKVVDPSLSRYVDAVFSSATSLLRLINDILDISKIEAGKFSMEYQPFSPARLFKEIAKTFHGRIEAKGITFTVIISKDLPGIINFDEARLRQILNNLLDNALKFTPSGEIVFTVKTNMSPKANMIISVEDTGIGIPDSQKNAVFEPFTQVKGQKQSQFGGTGLGLSITRQLIEMMGGDIAVKSREDKGSCFTVHFREIEIYTSGLLDRETEKEEKQTDESASLFTNQDILSIASLRTRDADELIVLLKKEKSTVRRLASKMIVNDIESFAEKTIKLAHQYDSPVLRNWSDNLLMAVHDFDVKRMERILNNFLIH